VREVSEIGAVHGGLNPRVCSHVGDGVFVPGEELAGAEGGRKERG